MPKKIKEKKGKKPHKNKPTSKKYKFYAVEGNSVKKARHCPRCGPGVFLAVSKKDGRLYCGKCHLTEFSGKSEKKD
jgi:small subunit ribosomal protein S27Ae